MLPLLKAAGFRDVIQYAPHAEPSGDFPNVPANVSNPENRIVFDKPIENAQQIKADIVLATDPDCDRMGCAAPLPPRSKREWATLNGNQLGALLTDFVLRKMKEAGQVTPQSYVVKTLVTTELTRRIAESHGVRCEGKHPRWIQWIAGLTDALDRKGSPLEPKNHTAIRSERMLAIKTVPSPACS